MLEAPPAAGSRESVHMTRKGLELLPDVGFEAWATLGRRITGITSACSWCLGDWLIYGEQAFGERYKTALQATSLDYQTLRNYAWVSRRFEMSRRRDTVSFQHHAEVAALPEAEQDLWLSRAERSGWSRNELRRRRSAQRCVGSGRSTEGGVRLSLEVPKAREQLWRQAATAAQQTLGDWMAAAVDAAADAALYRSAAFSVERVGLTPEAASQLDAPTSVRPLSLLPGSRERTEPARDSAAGA